MQGSDLFLGGFLNAVDAKGRVSLPAVFRKVLAGRARAAGVPAGEEDGSIFVGEDSRFGCLRGFDQPYARVLKAAFETRIDALDLDPVDRLDALNEATMETFGASQAVPCDSAGRIVIPAHLRAQAGIGELAWFVGNNDVIQIWSPERFEAECAGKARLVTALRAQLAERAK